MKFVLAVHGTRGDVEPCAAVGAELLRRGHEVQMAVPPNLLEFVETAGLTGVAYGLDSGEQINAVAAFVRNLTRAQNPLNLARAAKELFVEGWAEMGKTLATLTEGADLLMTGQVFHGVAANVAEHYDIPLAALHHFPMRVNGQIAIPFIPTPARLMRSLMTVSWRLYAYMSEDADRAQRDELGLPPAAASAAQRMLERGTPEIQAYDHVLFPGLAAEWNGQRPFVGALTMELHTEPNDELKSWIAAGTPPIYFGFGSTPVQSPSETVTMISDACAEVGERALIYSPPNSSTDVPHADHVKLVGLINYTTILPTCRAAVHHGGAGTTAACLRAGLPTLILWEVADQPIWAGSVKRLKIGSARRLSNITRKSLVAELRSILAPECAARARKLAPQMTKPAAGVAAAADLLEKTVRVGV
ncbi:putative glycosyltransferase [Mycobacterium simulans]|uniref:glycosyltransferase n=1 Tax=Mycobacterium simulans TaxID=627089 RepID=UPI0017488DE4|nr:glycosyltransferase [Mycobacterium simulans]SON63808.1 putative glycosyltransferase [Mycobacterium simulans]